MNAQQLRNAILQEAIEGRLVPQDPNDEPASKLLERICKEKQKLVKEGKLKKKDLEEKPISEDEIPFEIPESWEWVRLGDISTYANTKKKINAANADPNLWGLDLEDIEKGGRLLSFKSVGERKAIGDKTWFSGGDILYSKLRPYLLKVLIAPKDGICTTEIIPFSCYGNINQAYIVNLLKSSYVDDYINSVTFGVKMPRVSTETMVSLIVPLPPLAEQHRIVAKIEELLPKVEEYGKAQEKLNKLNEELPERLKKSILQEAIEGRLVKQDPNDEPASVLLAKIREEKKQLVKAGKLKKKDLEEKPISEDEIPFEVPESWEWCKLGTITSLLGGFAFKSHEYTSTGSRVIRISDITEEGFVGKNIVRYPYNAKLDTYVIQEGDILMAMTGGTVGKSLYVKVLPEEKMLLNQRVANIRTFLVFTDYIDHVIKSQHIQSIITDAKNSTNDNISMADIYNFPIPLPPLAEQHRIVSRIEELLQKVDGLKK